MTAAAAPGTTATDRLQRLLALVPYVVSRQVVGLADTAVAFGVSESELVDDLNMLWCVELRSPDPYCPIDLSYEGGEIMVTEAESMDRPLRLGTDEASALLIALRMLAELRGRRHTVLTGICVLRTGTESEALAVSRSLVKMRDFSDQELITYVASGEPLDKAGAYAVQGGGGDLVEAVSGRVDTVVGLDVALTLRLLAEAGFPDPLPRATDVPLTPPRRERRPLAPMRAAQRV